MIINNFILIFYSLAVLIARNKKNVINRATIHFIGTIFFFITLSILFFLLPKLSFRFSLTSAVIVLPIISYIVQYCIEKLTIKRINTAKIKEQYVLFEYKRLSVFLGLFILIACIYLSLAVGIFNFVGYPNK